MPIEPVYASVTGLALTTFKVFGWDVRYEGARNIPTRGPAIIAANHVGFLDFVFLGYGARPSGRRVRFMAMKEAFDHRIGGPLLRAMKHIPVDRAGDAASSLRHAIASLRHGEVVGIHPEARLQRSLVPGPAKTGAARMALETGAPLIPSVVWGSQRILPRGRKPRLPTGVAVRVTYGEALLPAAGEDATALTERLMARIRELYDRTVQRYPQRPRAANDRWWLPAHLGGTAPPPEGGTTSAPSLSVPGVAPRSAGT